MFKVNNNDTRTTSVTLFRCIYCWLRTYFTPVCSVSILDFEQVNKREIAIVMINILYFSSCSKQKTLTYLFPVHSYGFLMFSGCRERVHWLQTCITPSSGVSIVNFEYLNICWVIVVFNECDILHIRYIVYSLKIYPQTIPIFHLFNGLIEISCKMKGHANYKIFVCPISVEKLVLSFVNCRIETVMWYCSMQLQLTWFSKESCFQEILIWKKESLIAWNS